MEFKEYFLRISLILLSLPANLFCMHRIKNICGHLCPAETPEERPLTLSSIKLDPRFKDKYAQEVKENFSDYALRNSRFDKKDIVMGLMELDRDFANSLAPLAAQRIDKIDTSILNYIILSVKNPEILIKAFANLKTSSDLDYSTIESLLLKTSQSWDPLAKIILSSNFLLKKFLYNLRQSVDMNIIREREIYNKILNIIKEKILLSKPGEYSIESINLLDPYFSQTEKNKIKQKKVA